MLTMEIKSLKILYDKIIHKHNLNVFRRRENSLKLRKVHERTMGF